MQCLCGFREVEVAPHRFLHEPKLVKVHTEILLSKKSIHLVWITQQLFDAAVSTFKASGDKGWSFERYLDSIAPDEDQHI